MALATAMAQTLAFGWIAQIKNEHTCGARDRPSHHQGVSPLQDSLETQELCQLHLLFSYA